MNARSGIVRLESKPALEDSTSFVGMIVFLASWVMMFGALFFAYAYVRSHAASWPPRGLPPLPFLPGLINTLVLAGSSGAYIWAGLQLRKAHLQRATTGFWVSWLLGLLFVGGQVLLWFRLHATGLPLKGTGTYGSVFYGLTGLHAIHVLIGLGGLLAVCLRAQRGTLTATKRASVRLWGMYWHFMGTMWLLMFVSVFCL